MVTAAAAATLSLDRIIATRPFVGTSTSMNDNEGMAYVPADDSLWVVDDSTDALYEVDRSTGALGQVVTKEQFRAAPRRGTGAIADRVHSGDIEAVAYDAPTDTLYVFSGTCCTSSVRPAVFKLSRPAVGGGFSVAEWQPLSSPYDDLSGAEGRLGAIWAAEGNTLVRYDYATNSASTPTAFANTSAIYGVGFSPDGASLWLAVSGNRIRKYDWTTKALVPGYDFAMAGVGTRDARAVTQVGGKLYVSDGYDSYGSVTTAFGVRVYSIGGESAAPVAALVATPTSGVAPLTVAFSDASTGAPTSWAWNFGDGGSATTRNPSHIYTAAGTYTVRLTATNALGSDVSDPVTITVGTAPPVASFGVTPSSGTAPLAVSFTDTSTNSPTGWAWDFGDGSSSNVRNPSHTFTSVGSYIVRLTATNAGGSTSTTRTVIVTAAPVAPVASFTANPSTGIAPLTVQFTDTSTNAPTSWQWDFGDGATSTSRNPSHTYATVGTFDVTLTAANLAGADTSNSFEIVTNPAPPEPPDASFLAAPTTGTAPLAVQFTDTSTNGPTSWSWDFGDGTSSTARHPNHTFSVAGTYEVVLTATNQHGSDESEITVVTVAPVSQGETRTFLSEGDGYIDSSTPTTVRTSGSTLYNLLGAKEYRSYVKFSVAGMTGTVTSAVLRVWVTDGTSNGARWYSIPSNSWSEATLTWANAPQPTSGTLVANSTVVPVGAWLEIDVTAAVNGNGGYSFATMPESSDGEKFSTREGSNPPQLVVTTG